MVKTHSTDVLWVFVMMQYCKIYPPRGVTRRKKQWYNTED